MKAPAVSAFTRCCKALSDPTRVRVLRLIAQAPGPLCVCEIRDAMEERLYNISRHLKELKEAGFILGTRSGRWVYHELSPGLTPMHTAVLDAVRLLGDSLLTQDASRLANQPCLRKEPYCVIGPTEVRRQAQRKRAERRGTSQKQ